MKHDKITMPVKTFIAEHKKLIKTLRSGDRKKRLAEARDQKKELLNYLKLRQF
jgi:hypothetical protein